MYTLFKIREERNMNRSIDFEKLAKEIGGELIKINPSSSSVLNIFDMDKPNINDGYFEKKEMELRAILDEMDRNVSLDEISSKEYATGRLKDMSFLDAQPKGWKERATIILKEYSNKAIIADRSEVNRKATKVDGFHMQCENGWVIAEDTANCQGYNNNRLNLIRGYEQGKELVIVDPDDEYKGIKDALLDKNHTINPLDIDLTYNLRRLTMIASLMYIVPLAVTMALICIFKILNDLSKEEE